jgi:hypothetical protein
MYESILAEWSTWHEDYRAQLIADNEASCVAQEECLRDNIASWNTDAQLLALSMNGLVLEDEPEAGGSESPSGAHREDRTGMYVSGCGPFE